MFESATQGILSSIASCLSSRLELPAQQSIEVRVRIADPSGRSSLREEDILEFFCGRLREAGINAEQQGEGGCTLRVVVEIDPDDLCTFTLEFYRVADDSARATGLRRGRGGAWSLTHMARAESVETIRRQISLLAGEFIRQYMEAN